MTRPLLPESKPLEPEYQFPLRGPEGNPGTRVFLGLTGSHAYGIATKSSDEDWRGVFVWPTEKWLGLSDPKLSVDMAGDTTWWEVRHFLRMLIKGSVNAYELLWLDRSQYAYFDGFWDTLVSYRNDLFSESLWKAWNGVITGYRHELAKPGRLEGASRLKHLSHIVRFSMGLRHAVYERQVVVRLPEVPYLQSIREGCSSEEEALREADFSLALAQRGYESRPWPKKPRLDRIESLLLSERIARLQLPC